MVVVVVLWSRFLICCGLRFQNNNNNAAGLKTPEARVSGLIWRWSDTSSGLERERHPLPSHPLTLVVLVHGADRDRPSVRHKLPADRPPINNNNKYR